jgi:hypothetical protein
MKLLKPIVGVLGIAVLLLSTGDCVNLLFADEAAHECCLRGDCPSEQNQIDACCNVPISGSANYAQAGSKVSVSQPASTSMDFPETVFDLDQAVLVRSRSAIETQVQAPPDVEHALSLPLLI